MRRTIVSSTHWTSPVAHPDVALDVKSRGAGEPERLHVGKHLSLEEAAFRPGSTESADQFVVHGASVLIDQLDSLVAAVVGVTVVDHDVESVCWIQNHSTLSLSMYVIGDQGNLMEAIVPSKIAWPGVGTVCLGVSIVGKRLRARLILVLRRENHLGGRAPPVPLLRRLTPVTPSRCYFAPRD